MHKNKKEKKIHLASVAHIEQIHGKKPRLKNLALLSLKGCIKDGPQM
jgi:hypothetical protein